MRTQIKGKHQMAEILVSDHTEIVHTDAYRPGTTPTMSPTTADAAVNGAFAALLPEVAMAGRDSEFAGGRGMSSAEVAGGFERSEQLKILYLAQCYNLQQQLRVKLKRFGKNQITRSDMKGDERGCDNTILLKSLSTPRGMPLFYKKKKMIY